MRKLTITEALQSKNIKFKTTESLVKAIDTIKCGIIDYANELIPYGMVVRADDLLGKCSTKLYFDNMWDTQEEIELIEPKAHEFRYNREIWEYLFSGGKVISKRTKNIYAIVNEVIIRNNTETADSMQFSDTENWEKYFEPHDWWQQNNNVPTICWVTDITSHIGTKDCIAIVYRQNNTFKQLNSKLFWVFAEPLSKSELEEYGFKH